MGWPATSQNAQVPTQVGGESRSVSEGLVPTHAKLCFCTYVATKRLLSGMFLVRPAEGETGRDTW